MMLAVMVLLQALFSGYSFSATGENGNKYYINTESIQKVNDYDIWQFQYSEISAGGQANWSCIFRPHSNEYYIWSTSDIIRDDQIQSLNWESIPERSTISALVDSAISRIIQRKAFYQLDSVTSEPAIEAFQNQIRSRLKLIGNHFVKTPEALSKNIYQVWIVQIPRSGIDAQLEMGNHQVVERFLRMENSLETKQVRICDMVERNYEGKVISSDNDCDGWTFPVPGSFVESVLNYVLQYDSSHRSSSKKRTNSNDRR